MIALALINGILLSSSDAVGLDCGNYTIRLEADGKYVIIPLTVDSMNLEGDILYKGIFYITIQPVQIYLIYILLFYRSTQSSYITIHNALYSNTVKVFSMVFVKLNGSLKWKGLMNYFILSIQEAGLKDK